jgi:hypothetical protein
VTLSSKQSNTPDGQKHTQTGYNAVPVRIYLLTVWKESGQEVGIWRFRLEDPQTCRQRGFVNAHDLMAILEDDLPE